MQQFNTRKTPLLIKLFDVLQNTIFVYCLQPLNSKADITTSLASTPVNTAPEEYLIYTLASFVKSRSVHNGIAIHDPLFKDCLL